MSLVPEVVPAMGPVAPASPLTTSLPSEHGDGTLVEEYMVNTENFPGTFGGTSQHWLTLLQ